MKDIHFVAVVYLLLISASTFAVYGWDKLCAKRGVWRVPEKILLLLKFRYDVPLILTLQIAGLIYLHLK